MTALTSRDVHRAIVALERIGTGLLRIAKAAEEAVAVAQSVRTTPEPKP